MGGETGNLVSESLGLNFSDIINDTFVGAEVVGQSEKRIEWLDATFFTYFP